MPEPSTTDPILQTFSDLLRGMVDHPADLVVEISAGESETLVRVRAAQGDVGKLVGISGRSARALRTILLALGNTAGKRYVLDIGAL